MQKTQNNTIPKSNFTSNLKARKNKVIAFRFAFTPEIEIVITSLENCFIGLDRSEIVKLALNQLYKNNKLDQSDPLNTITNTKSNTIQTDEEFFDFWNNNKAELR